MRFAVPVFATPCRRHGYSLDKKPILRASHIGLRVLAEREYYGNWLDAGYYTVGNLNNALDDFLKSRSNDFGE